jgi:hypothetical protein
MVVVGARGVSRLGGATAGGAGPSWRVAPATRSARCGPEEGGRRSRAAARGERGVGVARGLAAGGRRKRGKKKKGRKEKNKKKKEERKEKRNRRRREIGKWERKLERILEKLEEFLGKLEEGFFVGFPVFRASA